MKFLKSLILLAPPIMAIIAFTVSIYAFNTGGPFIPSRPHSWPFTEDGLVQILNEKLWKAEPEAQNA